MRFQIVLVCSLTLAACAPAPPPAAPVAASSTAHSGTMAHDSTMGVHGMLMFGGEEIYLSHLPLYRAPHDWQMVLHARLLGEGDPAAAYRADRRTSGERVYTVEPERFPHSALARAAAGEPVRFRATVYRGHFERGGTPILRDVTVEVTRVIERRRLEAGEADAAEGRFLLFGGRGEAFLAHRIAGAPDFDQVVEVEIPAAQMDAATLARGIAVTAAGVRGGEPLREGTDVRLRTAEGREMAARVGRQLYLEHGDLASAP